ncbi:MAG TPA: hypothetical protein VFO46_18355 [Candidatus Sulfotelmatobacter sp.]|nr:hypothetical protein [Candidatus Sulfotelmatobacter sp.]
MPHFEAVNGRKVLFVDGSPFTALAAEIPWWDLIYGRYKETETAYDKLYPAAEKMGLNALKVPVKWSMVEPEKGVYDFSYVDHAKAMAEKYHLKLVLNWFGHYASGDGTIYANLTGDLYAPMYIVQDENTYPRAVDGNGVVHYNVISYDYEPIIEREIAAFRAFMQHIKQVDSQSHTILMIQVENEIATFGVDRKNPKMWRDHSAAANRNFADHGFTDDLKFSAWDLSYNWIRRITDAGAQIYPIPFFHNYVGGQIADWMVGGAPGEDVQTYLENCPHISFIGVNSYFCAEWRPDYSCGRESDASVSELREPLARYRVGRNLPAITEINSGVTPITSRLAFIAVGEFGVPIYAPWALTVSYPESNQPYVLSDGTLANGAFALRDTYSSFRKALPQIAYYSTTDKLKVFMSQSPGQRFSTKEDVNGFPVTVAGGENGQAIVVHPSGHEFLVVGYRAGVSFSDPSFEWPGMKQIRVEKVSWERDHWSEDGASEYYVNQSSKKLDVVLSTPQAVRVTW